MEVLQTSALPLGYGAGEAKTRLPGFPRQDAATYLPPFEPPLLEPFFWLPLDLEPVRLLPERPL